MNYRGTLQDIGEKGIFFLSSEVLTPETDLLMYIPLSFPNKQQLCMVPGTVIRIDPFADRSYKGYAIRFDSSMSESARELLSKYLMFRETGQVPTASQLAEAQGAAKRVQAPSMSKSASPQPVRRFESVQERAVRERASKKLIARPHRKTKNHKKTSKPFSGTAFVTFFWISVVGVTFVLAVPVYRSIQDMRVVSRLTSEVPLIYVEIEKNILSAQIKTEWMKNRSPQVQRQSLEKLAVQMKKEGIVSASLQNKEGKTVANISMHPGKTNKPNIHWLR